MEKIKLNKIKLVGVGSIPFTGEDIEAGKEYLFPIIGSLKSTDIPATTGEEYDEEKEKTFIILVSHVEDVIDLKTKHLLKVKKGKTISQSQRFAIYDYLKSIDEPCAEEYYEGFVKLNIAQYEGNKGRRELFDKMKSYIGL